MLDLAGHILFLSKQIRYFLSFYKSITYLNAIMHKNVIVFKMDIVIYTEEGM